MEKEIPGLFRAKKSSRESRGVGVSEGMTDPDLVRLREMFGGNGSRVNDTIQRLAHMGLKADVSPLVLKFIESGRQPHGLSLDQLGTVKTILSHLEQTLLDKQAKK